MRHILSSAACLLFAISTYGQSASPLPEPCRLKVAQAPAVRGVKLGMTIEDLFPLFPGTSDSVPIRNMLAAAEGYPKFGDTTLGLSPSNYPGKERFAGINSYMLRLFDHRIVGLTVLYDRFPTGARWNNTDDLIQRFSDSLHLPGPKDWPQDPTNPRKTLKCDGFEVIVTGGDEAVISFYAQGWEGMKRERLAAFEAQKRREFTP
jgi:hypothetical protein